MHVSVSLSKKKQRGFQVISLERIEVLEMLGAYKHSWRTDIQNKKLNNRDAIAFILFKLGPSRGLLVREIMSIWRHGKIKMSHSTRYVSSDASGMRGRSVPYTYFGCFDTYFNKYYGHCGSSVTSPGKKIHQYDYRKRPLNGTPATQFRRHFWFRLSKGTYAITLDGLKRMHELGQKALT